MSKKLTAKQVENAKPRLGKEGGKNEGQPVRTEISDGGSGLWLIVQPNGHKSWAVRYRVNGVPRKHTLEAISLADARVEAAEAIKQANNGNDPTKAKKAEKQKIEVAKANTFAAVAALYLDRKAKSKMRSIDQLRYRLTGSPCR